MNIIDTHLTRVNPSSSSGCVSIGYIKHKKYTYYPIIGSDYGHHWATFVPMDDHGKFVVIYSSHAYLEKIHGFSMTYRWKFKFQGDHFECDVFRQWESCIYRIRPQSRYYTLYCSMGGVRWGSMFWAFLVIMMIFLYWSKGWTIFFCGGRWKMGYATSFFFGVTFGGRAFFHLVGFFPIIA